MKPLKVKVYRIEWPPVLILNSCNIQGNIQAFRLWAALITKTVSTCPIASSRFVDFPAVQFAMSRDRYPSNFLKSNGGCYVYCPSNIFGQRGIRKLTNITRIFPSFSWGIFSHMTWYQVKIGINVYNSTCVLEKWTCEIIN